MHRSERTLSRHVIETMGTAFSLDIRDEVATTELQDAVDAVEDDLQWVDRTFSTYRLDSDISRLAAGTASLADAAREVADVLDLCAQWSRRTDGYFSATARGRLDPTGLVKGWAIGRVSRLLSVRGFTRFAVNGGGDVQTVGAPAAGESWRIGIADPHRPGEVAAVVSGVGIAVASSGTAERGAHIVDPYTGRPPSGLASVTVVAPDILTADVLATAAFAMGRAAGAWLTDVADAAAYVIDITGTATATPRFADYAEAIRSGSVRGPRT